jgi:hypothetical protein
MTPDERRTGRGHLRLFMYWGVVPWTDGTRLQLRPKHKVPHGASFDAAIDQIRADKAIIVAYLITRRDEARAELEALSPALEPYERAETFDDSQYQELLTQFGTLLWDYDLFCSMAPETPAAA